MTPIDVKKLSVEELVRRFVELTTRQDKAIYDDDNRRYNRLFDQMMETETELKSRPGDQRRALCVLHSHHNMQVRLMAAQATMEVALVQTRPVLEDIAKSGWYPQAADAGLALARLDGRRIVL